MALTRRGIEVTATVLLLAVLGSVGTGAFYWRERQRALDRRMVGLMDAHYFARGNPARQRAISNEIRLAVRRGVSPQTHDDDGVTPLILAAKSGDPGFVADALRAKSPVNVLASPGDTPLLCAIQAGNPRSVELLIAAGADVNSTLVDKTPLCEATFDGNVPIVRLLLAAGADPNLRTRSGRTPLSSVTSMECPERTELLRLLKQAGAR
ncbi:MAG: uncharacterized protein K0Q72_3060 [Armatimonadetes bacterium]|jgi:ankyrin repeat protein|nr:uncharacterized protein [Armatimonadota bacterium]